MAEYKMAEFQKRVIDELSRSAYERIEKRELTYCEIMTALIDDARNQLIHYDRCQRQ